MFARMLAGLAFFCLSAGAQDVRVTLLGTGSPPPAMDRFGPSTLIEAGEEKILVDCGRGATQRLRQLGIGLGEVPRLFLTHLHSDHVVGIPDLWLIGWIFGRQATPFEVRGPAGVASMMEHLEKAYAFDIHIRRDVDEKFNPVGISVIAEELSEGDVWERNGLKVIPFEVDHRPIVPAYGYRIEYGERVVVLSGDTRKSENLVKFAEGADLIVHEVGGASEELLATSATTRRVVEHHTLPEEVGEILSRVKPRMAVYAHYAIFGIDADEVVRRTKKVYDGPLEAGVDLMQIEIGDEVRVSQFEGGDASGVTAVPGEN